ncbi:TPA: hypothetical protein ACGXMA_005334 [Bacillus cereus]|uniref:TOMM leader peptide-binding protein n=3 Tax=Bacillus TaxID=1386 RepID=A0AAJ1KCU0_9BACI|nr:MULTISPECIES: hypothetical protein [Bacillus cereus group]AEW53697.1 Hypothetical protein bcf_02750 [Bacillus cereus F837/76]AJH67646.1 hypothetical protein BF32_3673 [Bacillus thuringiensis]EEK58189.1 hypothetical protein bcere0004_4470 [Bacillus cereus BGSC 6E1]MCC2347793.1 hypothetical protein [Bacillus anthracis]MCU4765533.1 hypothetical protein [Bacillus cereus]
MKNEVLNYKPIIDSYCFVKEDDEGLTFFNRDTYINFHGGSVEDIFALIPLLTGKLSTEQLAEKLELPIEYMCDIIKLLDEKNIIKNYDLQEKYKFMDKELQRYERFISNLTGSLSSAFEGIEAIYTKKIVLMGNEELQESVRKACGTKFSFLEMSQIQNASLIIAVDFCENENLFSEANELSKCYKVPFLRGVVQEQYFSIGPIFISNETGCYNCFLSRKITNYENSYLSYKYMKKYNSEWNETHVGVIPGTIEMLSFNILSFIMKYFSDCMPCEIIGKEFTYNVFNLSSNLNPVLKVPGCSICAGANKNIMKDFVLNS